MNKNKKYSEIDMFANLSNEGEKVILTIPVPVKESEQLKLSKFNKSITYKNPNDEWYTPKSIVDIFTKGNYDNWMDPATNEFIANKHGFKKFYTIHDNGLNQRWEGNVWCNPPFSLKDEFIKKAREYVDTTDNKVFMLLPASLETKIWHSYILGKAKIYIPNRRIKFENPCLEKQKGSSFTSVIVEFTKENNNQYEIIEI